MLGSIYRKYYKFSHPATMLKLYIAFVRPILEYVSFVWAPHKLKEIEMLERVLHFALKYPSKFNGGLGIIQRNLYLPNCQPCCFVGTAPELQSCIKYLTN